MPPKQKQQFAGPIKPIIFIPGIEATSLVDSNTFEFQVKWNAFDSVYTSARHMATGPYIEDRLQEDARFDEKTNQIIERNRIARLPYQQTIENISKKFPDDPIYLFGYDWRKSNVESGKLLYQYLQYLKEKLSGETVEGFRFITHSMGGLVFSCFLKLLKGDYSDLDKVIICAPPFKGSPYALIHMIKGNGGIKSFLNKIFGRDEDFRKVVRTYPSIFELLPWYEDAITFENGATVDLTNIGHWQPNVWDDIEDLFSRRLAELKNFRKEGLMDLSTIDEKVRKKIIILAGAEAEDRDKDDYDTIVKMKVKANSGPIKNFVDLKNLKTGDGDGTVPLQSSDIYKDKVRTILVEKENLIYEPSNFFDYHGLFLRDSRVQNIIMRMFEEEDEKQSLPNYITKSNLDKGKMNWWQSIGGGVKSVSPFDEESMS